jgi:DNA topoisomerase I
VARPLQPLAMAHMNGKTYKRLPVLQPEQSARAAGLVYVSDAVPGIARKPAGSGFRYLGADGRLVRDPATLARIRALAVPPAWQQVWICARADGHLQATGRDARGRKQHRYHRRWREMRDETKYARMLAFAQALPRIRARVAHDLGLPGLPREKILATLVHLLEATRMRVGNEEYARDNQSYGLTTLRTRQVRVSGGTISFRFRGKSGVEHQIELNDRRLATIVKRIRDLPGYELFQYLDEQGERRSVESADVNDYIRQAAGEEFTSKDFRTWAGTVLAAQALRACERCESEAQGKRNVARAIEEVARLLGNTKAVCRKCYVHPAVLEGYIDGSLAAGPVRRAKSAEAAVVALLKARNKRDAALAKRSGAAGTSLAPVLARSISRLRMSGRRAVAASAAAA